MVIIIVAVMVINNSIIILISYAVCQEKTKYNGEQVRPYNLHSISHTANPFDIYVSKVPTERFSIFIQHKPTKIHVSRLKP